MIMRRSRLLPSNIQIDFYAVGFASSTPNLIEGINWEWVRGISKAQKGSKLSIYVPNKFFVHKYLN